MYITKENKIIITVIVVILLILLGLFIRSRAGSQQNNGTIMQLDNGLVKVTGKFSCLPLRSGVFDTNCALGFKTPENIYYGLDTSSASSMASNLTPEDDLAITGTFADADELKSDTFKIYDISGVLKVKDIFRDDRQ